MQAFASARERAPCFLILDNLDIILGHHHHGDDDDDDNDHHQQQQLHGADKESDDDDDDSTNQAQWEDLPDDYNVDDDDTNDDKQGNHRQGVSVSSTLYSPKPVDFSSSRTRHAAIDRLLSTLLVEMDGLKLPPLTTKTSSSVSSNADIESSSSTGIKGRVVMIATVTDMSGLDR